MAKNEIITQDMPEYQQGAAGKLLGDLGIDKKLVSEVIRAYATDAIRQAIPGAHKANLNQKHWWAKLIEGVRSIWWVPAVIYFTVMLSVVIIKLLSRLAGV